MHPVQMNKIFLDTISFPDYQSSKKISRRIMHRRDSTILAFRLGLAASGRGLCDIDRVLFRVTKLRLRKLESPCTIKLPW